ncbi:hypothetical protein T01_3371 [Trichinella spiralis]|uniref:Uncharacterized protein n=1 Tax=Trichinella spiralis TaxID=6334 RepID=A0A0V0Z2E4_TRISP|nr:hypothetical protein T01_3371 [Trichinella spiralis]
MNGEQLLVPFRDNFKWSVHAPDRLSSQFPCWRVAGSGGKRLARLLYIADFTLLNVGN